MECSLTAVTGHWWSVLWLGLLFYLFFLLIFFKNSIKTYHYSQINTLILSVPLDVLVPEGPSTALLAERAIIHDHTTCVARAVSDG